MSAIEKIVLREKRRWWTPIDTVAEKRRWVSALEAPEAKASELGPQSSSQASSFLTGAADRSLASHNDPSSSIDQFSAEDFLDSSCSL